MYVLCSKRAVDINQTVFPNPKIIKNGKVVQEEMNCAVRNQPNGPKEVATGIQPYDSYLTLGSDSAIPSNYYKFSSFCYHC